MDKSMIGPFLWNMLAWFAWGVLILGLRYAVERRRQRNDADDAMDALEGRA
jgi:heme exporter protein C